MKTNKSLITQQIKQEALNSGFTACGIAKAGELIPDASRLKIWLGKGMHSDMRYMQNYFDKRIDPRKLMPGTKSVIVVLLNYFPSSFQNEENYFISKYAYGQDYHAVMKKMLRHMVQRMQKSLSTFNYRIFVDSAPVLERSWALRAGLGWIGKNTHLISPEYGSFCFLGEILTDLSLVYDIPITDKCGNCTRCIQACPTQAIADDRYINCNKCISYHTIENRSEIPAILKGKFNNRIFGCDICQDVCPWNHKAVSHTVEEFKPSTDFLNLKRDQWKSLSEEQFNTMFGKSAVKRTGYTGLMRNIRFVDDLEH